MASTGKAGLEKQDRERDAAFNKAMHGNSAQAAGGIRAMFAKSGDAKQAAVDEYFKHWDNQAAKDETEETREVSLPTRSLTG
jgi:sterol 24-C-methyltransferase